MVALATVGLLSPISVRSQEYAALQRFTPFRSEHAHCMNWERMIAEFSFPLESPNYVRCHACALHCCFVMLTVRSPAC